uniref:Uncharacterized protein n=1 Tax=Solanum lycopersicum TaxID=4081 RepID=A0A3Q7IHX7_SOLLC
MKPLRIENEVDSNMKNTIKYTFITPSAIEKGQGRGLKSLDEKRNLPSKSIFPQSSDLFKKHIKEIETNYKQKKIFFPAFCILCFIIEEKNIGIIRDVSNYNDKKVLQGRNKNKDLQTLPCPLVKEYERRIRTSRILRKRMFKLILHLLHLLIQ